MDALKGEILLLCKDFIKAADNLYKNGWITYEKYVKMTGLKREYINNMEKPEQYYEKS